MLEGFDGYVCDCWWFCLHCSSIMSTTILSKVIYTYTHISYMSISIYYCIYVYLYICNMTWLNNLYICVYINLSSNCWFQNFCLAIDTAAASSHSPEPSPGLGLQGLAIDGEGKGVCTRPHSRCPRTELSGEKKTGKVDSFPMKSLQPPHKIEVWQGPIVFWFFPGKPSGSGTQTSSLGKRTSSRRRWS